MPERILEIEELRVTFRRRDGGRHEAVRGISLALERGETVALLGESGSGKSATALSVPQLLPPEASCPGGSIRFKGEEMIGASKAALRRVRGNDIGVIFQEPDRALNPVHTVVKQVSEVLTAHQPLNKARARARAIELLESVRFEQAERRMNFYPHQLSGGERQRVMIAQALANGPELLIADEPTAGLDVTIQAELLALLKDLASRMQMAMLLITHDLAIVRRLADRVCVMRAGEIVESGAVARVFEAPRHEHTRELIAAEPEPAPVPCNPEAPILLEAVRLSVRYAVTRGWFGRQRRIDALTEVSLAVREGRTLGLLGESASGKTTLGLALLRLVPSSGRIVFDGKELHRYNEKAMVPLRGAMQIVFQDPFGSLSPRARVHEIVGEGLLVHRPRMSEADYRREVAGALEEVGLDPDSMARYPDELSGGERQRIAIARALVLRPRLLFLDEPTSSVDRSVQARILELLRELQRRRRITYLFASHDIRVLRALAHDMLVLRNGTVIEYGSVEQVIEQPRNDYTRRLVAASLELKPHDPA